MTQPPIDPMGGDRPAESSPTQPWPAFAAPEPMPGSTAAPPPAPDVNAPGGYATYAPGVAFMPVTPEPGPGDVYPVPMSRPVTRSSGSSRILNIGLAAAILVGAVGIAFAAGRATSPASNTANAPAAGNGGVQGGGVPNGNGGAGNGNGNGNGGVNGGNLPGASFDLNGNGNGGPGGRPGDDDGGLGFDRGRGFGGFGGLGLSGTVTAVTPDSITIQTDAGPVITFSLDGTTTYHQQADASASDVKTGSKVQVSPSGRIQPTQGANGEIDLGTAGSITIVP